MAALDGIRVLDLTWGTAALGILLLAEQGADTIKVEPPDGDPFRSYEGYKVWTRSRRSVTANLKSDAGREAFLALTKTADVVVDSFSPGVMDRLGVGADTLRAANPRLVTCSVPGYPVGHRLQHRPGYDALVAASSGQQFEQPGWRPGPIFLPMPMPSSGMIWLVASGILSALHARETTGRGQHVQTSLLQGAWLYTTQIWQQAEKGDAAYYGMMAKSYPPGIHQPMIFECADGFVHLSVMSGLAPKKSIDEILGLEPLPPETFEGMIPIEIHTLMSSRQRDAIKTWKRDELVAQLVENNHAVEAIIAPEDQFGHPQLQANDMVATVDDPDLGTTTQLGVPIHLLGTPGAIVGGQPRVGEHNDAIWGELGLTASQIHAVTAPVDAAGGALTAPIRSTGDLSVRVRALAEPGETRGPLAGLVLVDFGQYLAGPFGPMILGDLGMDVIKVEPVTGDGMRMAGTPFFGCQRGKRDVALNLKDPQGLELALELVAKADVVHHNMTKGTAARLGLDYHACRAVNDTIIYCNTYAYGLNGPLSTFGGLDPLYQASAGLEHELGGVEHGNQPLYYRFGMCDAANAMLSVVGVLLALVHRDRTGDGQELWTSLMDGGAWHASDVLLRADGTPSVRPKVDLGQHGFGPEYRLYETQDGTWLQIAAVHDDQWRALCTVLGVPDDPDRWTVAGQVEAAFRTKTALQWSHALDDAGVPNELAVDVKGGDLALNDDDAARLGLVVEYLHPIMGRLKQFGELVNFSETPARVFGPPPRVGEHTLEILDWLGRGADAATLNEAGVVYWPDERYAWSW